MCTIPALNWRAVRAPAPAVITASFEEPVPVGSISHVVRTGQSASIFGAQRA